MLIRYGYDITLHCWQPTPMVTMLSVRDERMAADAESPESTHSIPAVPITTYRDLFGNTCTRFTAPSATSSCGATARSPTAGSTIPSSPTPPRRRSPSCRTSASSTSWAAAIARPTG